MSEAGAAEQASQPQVVPIVPSQRDTIRYNRAQSDTIGYDRIGYNRVQCTMGYNRTQWDTIGYISTLSYNPAYKPMQ